MEPGIWIAGSGGQIPDGAVVCGREANGDPLFVARANLNGGLHPAVFLARPDWRKCR
jgi:hypothetical protein